MHSSSTLGLVVVVAFVQCGSIEPVDVGDLPAAPQASTRASTLVSTFAIDSLLVGDVSSIDGKASNTAWQRFGYDLDGLSTTQSSVDVCTLAVGAPPFNQVDGQDGIDNAWGSVLLPILQVTGSEPAPSAMFTSVIAAGGWTLQIEITGLSPDSQQTAQGLSAQVFVGGPLGARPTFDQTTRWPVLASSVRDGATIGSGAVVRFTDVYVTGGTVVAAGATAPLVLPLTFTKNANVLVVRVHHPVLTFVHSTASSATAGIIAGVLDPQESVESARLAGQRASTSLCDGAFDGLAQEIAQAADILADGTNAPGVPCTGISFGMGFTAKLVANPATVVGDPPGSANPCPMLDAGAD